MRLVSPLRLLFTLTLWTTLSWPQILVPVTSANQTNPLKEQLKRGIIPQVLLEDWRVSDLNTQAAKDFDREINQYVQKIFTHHDFSKQPVRFIIIDKPNINAFVVKQSDPIIIGITKGAIQSVGSLDELLYIIGHEFGHLEYLRKHGEGSNSKVEEYSSDLYPLRLLEAAGYDSKQALTFARRIDELKQNRRDPSETRFSEIMDVHGLSENRKKLISMAMAVVDRERGGLKNTPRPMPASILEAAKQSKHNAHIPERLENKKFEDLNLIEKLNLLTELLKELEPDYDERLRAFLKAIDSLEINEPSPVEQSAINRFANAILEHPERIRIYRRFSEVASHDGEVRPMGRLSDIAKAALAFKKSESRQDAIRNAQRLLEEIEKSKLPNEFLRELKWPNFALPKPSLFERRRPPDVTVSWNDFVEYAQRDTSQSVARALIMLGIDDPRIYEDLPLEFAKDLFDEKITPISKGPSSHGAKIIEFSWDEDGNVFDYQDSILDEEIRAHRERNKQLLKNAIAIKLGHTLSSAEQGDGQAIAAAVDALKTISFNQPSLSAINLLESRYEDFFDINLNTLRQDLLVAEQSNPTTSGPTPVMQLLIEFDRLLKKDKQKHSEMVRGFFLGRSDKRDMSQFSSIEINADHAISNFILNDTHQLFTQDERLKIIYNFWLFFGGAGVFHSSFSDRSLRQMRELIGYNEPSNYQELTAALALIEKRLKSIEPSDDWSKAHFRSDFMMIELRRYLARTKEPQVALEKTLKFIPEISHQQNDPGYRNFILSLAKKYVIPRKRWPTSAKGLLEAWQVHDSNDLFSLDQAQRLEILTQVIQKIEATPEPKLRFELFNQLLLGGRIFSPPLRERAMNLWIETVYELHGTDDNSRPYQEKIINLVKGPIAEMVPMDSETLIYKLAERIQSQQALSLALDEELKKKLDPSDQSIAQHSVATIEALLLAASKRESHRMTIIDFLISPLSKSTLNSIAELMKSASEFSESSFQAPMDFYRNNAKIIYENFWASPLAARAVILNELLFPKGGDSAQEFNKSFNFVLNRLFKEGPYDNAARQLLKDYVEVIPDYQRTLLISSLMVAAQKSIERETQTSADSTSAEATRAMEIGEKLAIVLELMGPAETKVGQATHSHPSVPDDIRAGMKRLKQNADPPRRWNLFDWFYKSVPEEQRKDIVRVKDILGSASYYVVFEVETVTGESQVFAVLKPNALSRAKNGFELLMELAKKRSASDPIYDTLISLIDQGRFMADIETDSQLGAKQADIAARLYDGMNVSVGARQFKFEAAKVLDSGANYRRMTKAQGKHFNDLPESTAEERQYKADLARAYFALEVHLMINGHEFDHDRHGAQMKVEGDKITLFDFGAMALTPPTTQERQQAAEVIFDSMQAVAQGGDLANELFQRIRHIHQKTGAIPRYLITIQKGLLALQDFARYIPKNELVSIIKQAAEAGMHEDIQLVMLQKALENPALMQSFVGPPSQENCSKIIIMSTKSISKK